MTPNQAALAVLSLVIHNNVLVRDVEVSRRNRFETITAYFPAGSTLVVKYYEGGRQVAEGRGEAAIYLTTPDRRDAWLLSVLSGVVLV